MMRYTRQLVPLRSGPHPPRCGFSMVELLVVIGIVALLVTILALALGPTLQSGRIAATRVTISQINDVIQQRIEAVNNADLTADARRLAGGSGGSLTVEQAEFILRKNLYRKALPQRIEDFWGLERSSSGADNEGGRPPGCDDSSSPGRVFLKSLIAVSAIRAMPGGKTYQLPLLELDNINRHHIALDSGEPDHFIDDWGTPLRFYNWPTRLFRPDGTNNDGTNNNITQLQRQAAQILVAGVPAFSGTELAATDVSHALNQDPFDPTDRLRQAFTASGGVLITLPDRSFTVAQFTQDSYHTRRTYHVPLLVSAGPDGVLGLQEPNGGSTARLGEPTDSDTGTDGIQPDLDSLSDNITNRQQ